MATLMRFLTRNFVNYIYFSKYIIGIYENHSIKIPLKIPLKIHEKVNYPATKLRNDNTKLPHQKMQNL